MNTPRTPREILLARHADAARAALDAQRHALLARFGAVSATPLPTFAFRDILAALHRELFVPCRRGWATLACTWAVLLAFQQFERLSAPALPGDSIAHADSALLVLWIEQRRQLANLGSFSFGPSLPEESASSATTPSTLGNPAPATTPRPLGARSPTGSIAGWV